VTAVLGARVRPWSRRPVPRRGRTSRTPGAFAAIYRLMLRNQASIGRVLAVMALGVGAIVLGGAVGLQQTVDPVRDGAELINRYGLTILVPVVTLVFSSSTLGDLIDDRTLVYLWLRPVNRLTVAAAAAAAAMTICLPAVTVPLVISAALTGGGIALVGGTAVAAAVGVVGYCGMFVALGLRFKRALVWGLAYILLWEGYVAKASKTASRLSLRAYTRSVVSQYTGVRLDQAGLTIVAAVVVPVVVGVVFVLLTGRRLKKTAVD
jgi:ABC-2 type transport system permease protein